MGARIIEHGCSRENDNFLRLQKVLNIYFDRFVATLMLALTTW